MRSLALAFATTAAILAGGALAPAHAMAISTPAGIAAAVDTTSLAQDVAYICRPVRRCGPGGCWVRRSCFWTGGGYGWRRGYGYRRGYYGGGGHGLIWLVVIVVIVVLLFNGGHFGHV